MKKIAISGNIASGKSTVQKMLEDKGYKILDTDDVSRELLTVKNTELFEAFKEYDVFENGEFSRYKVAQLIFNEEEPKRRIIDVMHPQINEKIKEFFEKNKDEKFLFVGIPLLFESNMENLFDKILFIYTDDEIRLERLLKRNNYTLEHAKARMSCQMSQEEKVKKSDFVINNNGDIENLKSQVEKFLADLVI